MKEIKLGIVDDEKLIVDLLCGFFDSQPEFRVVLKSFNGTSCIESLETSGEQPNLLLVDLKMEGMDGTELIRKVRELYPEIYCVVMSSLYQPSFMGYMLKSGALAFLPKEIAPSELKKILIEVHRTGYYFLPEQLNVVRSQVSSKAPRPELEKDKLLTEREIEVLKLLCQQKTAPEIGELLFISQRTVDGHKNNMFAKTGAKNLAGLVIFAIQNGIVNTDEILIF